MDALLATALEAAEAAAHVHRRAFGRIDAAAAEDKSHSDFVTRVDLEAQEAALAVIRGRFPEHGILAEEEEAPESERRWPEDGTFLWIVDPLDGTTNFLHRHPYFSASVGVGRKIPQVGEGHEDTEPMDSGVLMVPGVMLEAGAVVAARTGERWWARRGEGAFKNGIPISVSGPAPLARALVGTGFPFKKPELVEGYLREFQRVLPASSGIRRTGSAAMDLCYLAEGILDAFWEAFLSPWDIAAGLVILQEAGGTAVRVDGSGIDLANGSVLAANDPETLQALGSLVRDP